MTELNDVHLTGFGTYVPEPTVTGERIAAESGVPEEVVLDKMGVVEKHVCPPDTDHVTDMGETAAERALTDAGLGAADLDLLRYHGSEYKDYVVWSAAADLADRLDARSAYADESYALCAGFPLALRATAAQLRTGDVERALLVGASREEDLVDYGNERSSFMFNFGSGACAAVLEAGRGGRRGGTPSGDGGMPDGTRDDVPPPAERTRGTVRASAARTDGSFSEDVVMPAGGSKDPPSEETVARGLHTLDVSDPEGMKDRLAEVSAPAFLAVADEALERSGYGRRELDFVALTHMKRSFHEYLTGELGVGERGSYYLDDYGHVQSVDQLLALSEGLDANRVEPGSLVLFLAAGTGYTWSATVVEWAG